MALAYLADCPFLIVLGRGHDRPAAPKHIGEHRMLGDGLRARTDRRGARRPDSPSHAAKAPIAANRDGARASSDAAGSLDLAGQGRPPTQNRTHPDRRPTTVQCHRSRSYPLRVAVTPVAAAARGSKHPER
jgi:hypothetical protein